MDLDVDRVARVQHRMCESDNDESEVENEPWRGVACCGLADTKSQ